MIALIRAGWLASAVLFGVLLASLLHIDVTGLTPLVVLSAIVVAAAVRPDWGLPAVAALVPIAWYTASSRWNVQVAWAEALVCAALTGLALDACRARTRAPRELTAPAAVLGTIVVASLAANLGVLSLREGPGVWDLLATRVLDAYLTDHSLTGIHAGLLLLEGTLLFVHAARLGVIPGVLRRITAATALGSAVAALCTLARLVDAAKNGGPFWRRFFDLAAHLRLNVHYADFNAAGSYFALALLVAAALAVSSSGLRRAIWIACGLLASAALWLTSSRIAMLAVPAAAAGALILPLVIRGRRQAAIAAAAGVAVCAVLAIVVVALPQRGIQKSPLLAADVRVGLVETGLRMMRASPAFGIGLGEFHRRTAEFSSPDLLEKFPAVLQGENAHNNFVQIAAETGIAGGLAFTWTIAAALLAVAWRATATRDRFLQLVFAGLAAFALTMLAGHPLLVPEAAFGFWLLAGAAGGAALAGRTPPQPRARRSTMIAAVALALIAVTLPFRMRAAGGGTDLEHVGIGVTGWRLSPDGIRYREAIGQATFYVPAGAYKFSVSLRADGEMPMEVTIDGRTADVRVLTPNRWTDIVIPARTIRSDARFRRMDLRTMGDPRTILWVTKDEPVAPR